MPTTRRQALIRLGGGFLAAGPARSAAAAPSFAGRPVELQIRPVTAGTLRISLLPAGATVAEDPVILPQPNTRPLLQSASIARSRSFRWGLHRITVSPDPLAIAIHDRHGLQIQRLEFSAGAAEFRFRTGSLPLFGMGEGGPQYDRRNHQYTMRNGQYNPDQRIEGGRMPVPWIFSPEGWGLFIHQPYGITSLVGPAAKFTAQSPVLPLNLFLLIGRQPADVLREYVGLTGYPHLPPLWSLGYQQSHRTLASRDEVLSEAAEFRRRKLPCDTMIYLGTGFCPSGWNTGHGSFQFNEKVFPDPGAMIAELHRDHFHVVLHLTEPPPNLHGTVSDPAGAADSGSAARYWSTHLDVFRLGVDGWWPDEGDKLSPESRFARDRMYWEGPIKDRPNVRPFALHRNGYAGIQRYGWLWTGDVNSDWRALAAQIPVGINTALTGMPYWGTDIGGFLPTREFTGELYVRWFQFGAFCPLFRSHGRTWKLHLPWGWNTGDYGPIEVDPSQLPDRSNLHNPEVEPICRKYLELRYQLLPYLYSAVRQAHDTGIPLIRAMWLHYPDDPEAMARGDQYLWGREILVAPVIQPAATHRNLYLPQGAWYDFWTGERLTGGRVIDRAVDLATMPLYVREGAILPFGPVKQYVTEEVPGPLLIRIYPGANGRFELYQDDGISFSYQRGDFSRIVMTWNNAARELTVQPAPDSQIPWTRDLDVRIGQLESGRQAHFDGRRLVLRLAE